MNREIRGRFVKGKVELLEESGLEEGEEVRVIVPFRKKELNEKSFMSTSGAWKDDVDCEELIRIIYESRSRGICLEEE